MLFPWHWSQQGFYLLLSSSFSIPLPLPLPLLLPFLVPTSDASTSRGDGIQSDPYRLYNLDVFEYELNVPMALYELFPMWFLINLVLFFLFPLFYITFNWLLLPLGLPLPLPSSLPFSDILFVSIGNTVGVLWLNAGETWIDVTETQEVSVWPFLNPSQFANCRSTFNTPSFDFQTSFSPNLKRAKPRTG